MNAPELSAFYDWLAMPPEQLLEKECKGTPYQASGLGGQKRNRVYSAIRLEHTPSGIRAESAAHREAARNRADALRKLRLSLALTGSRLIPLARPQLSAVTARHRNAAGTPVELSRLFGAKVSVEHKDFPAMVLQALVEFRMHGGEPRPVAEGLGVSTSAFVKFLKLDKALLAEANAIRKDLGRDSLR